MTVLGYNHPEIQASAQIFLGKAAETKQDAGDFVAIGVQSAASNLGLENAEFVVKINAVANIANLQADTIANLGKAAMGSSTNMLAADGNGGASYGN